MRRLVSAGWCPRGSLHVAVSPIEIGSGERLWNSPDDLLDRFHRESVLSPSGITHLLYWRE